MPQGVAQQLGQPYLAKVIHGSLHGRRERHGGWIGDGTYDKNGQGARLGRLGHGGTFHVQGSGTCAFEQFFFFLC